MSYPYDDDFTKHDKEVEDARRLARYDEAVRLLRLASECFSSAFDGATWEEAKAFLAAEPKEGK